MKQSNLRGGFSRRKFLQQSAILGASAALPLSFGAQAAPKRGGHFRLGIGAGATGDSLDPANYANSFTQGLGGTLHATLTEVAPDGSLAPMLAERWRAQPGAKQWTFELVRGAEFHNGKTVTADDVVASINHHRGEDSKSGAKPLLKAITSIKAAGANRINVTLRDGNADLPLLFADFRLVVMPSTGGTADVSGIGAGPFALKNFEPGVRAAAERHANYFRDGKPYFDSVELIAILDVVARTSALITGDVDYIDRCDLKTVDRLKRRKGVVVAATDGRQYYTIPMRMNVAPFDNNDVRLALKYAIDREEIVKKILRGYGNIGNDNPISRQHRYFNADLRQHNYDPDQAKHHLKKAGMQDLTLDLSASDAAFVGCEDTAVLYKEHAAKAGITINVIREPKDGYWSNVWNKKPWSFSYWAGREEDYIFTVVHRTGAEWNETAQANARFDELLVKARAELDDAKRREMYGEMQRYIHAQGGTLVPMFANYVNAHSDKFTHHQVGGNLDLDGMRIAERWWRA
jgi:peptide/nickel transport system substrate-binding protein